MKLGECLGEETLLTEFKEFTGRNQPSNYFNEREIRDIVDHGKLPLFFDKYIHNNIRNYIHN